MVRQVIESRRPVIVSDALTDTTFGKSESVIALKLSSVMCVPLLSQGEAIGALYVANDEVKHLFERPQLDLLQIFGSQASLILQNAMLLSARSSAAVRRCSRCFASYKRSPAPTSTC